MYRLDYIQKANKNRFGLVHIPSYLSEFKRSYLSRTHFVQVCLGECIKEEGNKDSEETYIHKLIVPCTIVICC